MAGGATCAGAGVEAATRGCVTVTEWYRGGTDQSGIGTSLRILSRPSSDRIRSVELR